MQKRTKKNTLNPVKTQRFYCPKNHTFYQNPPPTTLALPDGLLAISSQLTPSIFISAYQRGVFPWIEKQELVFWFSPQPRMVFFPDSWCPPRTIKRALKKAGDRVSLTVNHSFKQVLEESANRNETWISDRLKKIYTHLHQEKRAISFEVYDNNELVGGLFAVILPPIMFAESMFSLRTGSSKLAFYRAMQYARERQLSLVDAQVDSPHLRLLGGDTIDRESFEQYLSEIEEYI